MSTVTFADRDLCSEGCVKIYNVKMVNTEMDRGPQKLCQEKNPFGSLQTNPRMLMLGGLGLINF